METSLLAPCNYYCGNCILYKKSKCLDCSKATEKASAEGRVFCDISVCAKDRKLSKCFDCESYLCEKYDKSIFSESFIKWIRDKLKKTITCVRTARTPSPIFYPNYLACQ